MRNKTTEKRDQIKEIATCLFTEKGYERTSMSAISARLGGSKATLYNYFSSKEELFYTVMEEAMAERAEQVFNILDDKTDDLSETLKKFAIAYLGFITSDEILKVVRTVISRGVTKKLGPLVYDKGPKTKWKYTIDYIERMMDKGLLIKMDPEVAGMHFKGIIESGIMEPALFSSTAHWTHEIAAQNGVKCFMAAYGTRAES